MHVGKHWKLSEKCCDDNNEAARMFGLPWQTHRPVDKRSGQCLYRVCVVMKKSWNLGKRIQVMESFLTRECDSNERVIAVSVGKIHSIDRYMSVNNGQWLLWGPEPIRRTLVSIYGNSL